MPATTRKPAIERRQFVRVPARCHITAERIQFTARLSTQSVAETRNLGTGGLLFVSNQEFSPDDLCKVIITLRDTTGTPSTDSDTSGDDCTAIVAVCRVVHSRRRNNGSFEVGVRFESVHEEDINDLRKFIERYQPKTTVS